MAQSAFVALMGLALSLNAPPPRKGADVLVGAIWEFKFNYAKDAPAFRLRATPDGKVFDLGAAEVGTWTGGEDKAEMIVTGLQDRRAAFNGTYALTRITQPGAKPRWSGKFTFGGKGNTRDIFVKLIRD